MIRIVGLLLLLCRAPTTGRALVRGRLRRSPELERGGNGPAGAGRDPGVGLQRNAGKGPRGAGRGSRDRPGSPTRSRSSRAGTTSILRVRGAVEPVAPATPERTASHVFPNYLITYLIERVEWRIRFRKNPGSSCFRSRGRTDPNPSGGGGRVSFSRDGTMAFGRRLQVHEVRDGAPLPLSGYHGLRTWRTKLPLPELQGLRAARMRAPARARRGGRIRDPARCCRSRRGCPRLPTFAVRGRQEAAGAAEEAATAAASRRRDANVTISAASRRESIDANRMSALLPAASRIIRPSLGAGGPGLDEGRDVDTPPSRGHAR